jgi:hypothetical protein
MWPLLLLKILHPERRASLGKPEMSAKSMDLEVAYFWHTVSGSSLDTLIFRRSRFALANCKGQWLRQHNHVLFRGTETSSLLKAPLRLP